MMIDKGAGFQFAVYARAGTFIRPASFPDGYIVAGDVVQAIAYSNSGCTGTAYVQSIYASGRFREVLYQVPWTTNLFKGAILPSAATRAIASRRQTGTGECIATSGTINAVVVTATSLQLDAPYPWSMVNYGL
ncbi:MAG: hypothetical protein JRG90_12530 [Deltaproteobacteria bacterium]|nr:hypothetical protein [Deltaproteobacteria bacterium]